MGPRLARQWTRGPWLGLPCRRVLWAAALRRSPYPCACPRGLPQLLGRRLAPRPRTLTCFSTLTTRPIILISSTASVSEGPLSPFSRVFRSPSPRPTICSTLWGKGTIKAQTHAIPPTRAGDGLLRDTACTGGRGQSERRGRFALPNGYRVGCRDLATALTVFHLAKQRHDTQA